MEMTEKSLQCLLHKHIAEEKSCTQTQAQNMAIPSEKFGDATCIIESFCLTIIAHWACEHVMHCQSAGACVNQTHVVVTQGNPLHVGSKSCLDEITGLAVLSVGSQLPHRILSIYWLIYSRTYCWWDFDSLGGHSSIVSAQHWRIVPSTMTSVQ